MILFLLSDVAIECFEKTKKNLPLMPLQSLKHFTILYCGTRPNTMIPRQSRSVSPVKDNSNTATEKPKSVSTGVTSRPTHRLLTQSTPLFAASNQRKSIEKLDSGLSSRDSNRTETHFSAKSSNSSASARTILPAIVTKTDDNIARMESRAPKTDNTLAKLEQKVVKTETTAAKTENRVAKSEKTGVKSLRQDAAAVKTMIENRENTENRIKDTETSTDESDIKVTDEKEIDNKEVEKIETDNKDVEKMLNESEEGNVSESITRDERKPSVVDTLTRTQNSLNLATNALGKINISLNQVGLTDSLLEEVRLKMTHADASLSGGKPNSSRSARGQRENLDRGN